MQPDWAGKLRTRKVGNLRSLNAAAVVTGNIGCLTQIAGGLDDDRDPPVLHTVEILDWVTGGPLPEGLAAHTGS
jgi:glycolate oxidase iron-sulfur subunit